jgi:hypothetical protein
MQFQFSNKLWNTSIYLIWKRNYNQCITDMDHDMNLIPNCTVVHLLILIINPGDSNLASYMTEF